LMDTGDRVRKQRQLLNTGLEDGNKGS
jgi:hypothetical protein